MSAADVPRRLSAVSPRCHAAASGKATLEALDGRPIAHLGSTPANPWPSGAGTAAARTASTRSPAAHPYAGSRPAPARSESRADLAVRVAGGSGAAKLAHFPLPDVDG